MSRRAEIEINKTKMLPNETYRYNGRPFITGKTGKFKKFVTEEELEQFKEAKEAKESLDKMEKEDLETSIKARIRRQREEKEIDGIPFDELKKSPEMQSEKFTKAKQEFQNAYVDLITTTKTDARNRKVPYNPSLKISEQIKFLPEFNKVINAQKKLKKVTKKLSSLRGDSVYVDTLNTVRELLGNDTNFSAQLPGKPSQPKEEPKEEVPEERTPVDARRYFNPYTRSGVTSSIEIPKTKPTMQRDILETKPQTLPGVLQQPKKSTQDADRKKRIDDEELKRILGS